MDAPAEEMERDPLRSNSNVFDGPSSVNNSDVAPAEASTVSADPSRNSIVEVSRAQSHPCSNFCKLWTDKLDCEACQTAFSSSEDHQQHMFAHLRLACLLCDGIFTDYETLKTHSKVHSSGGASSSSLGTCHDPSLAVDPNIPSKSRAGTPVHEPVRTSDLEKSPVSPFVGLKLKEARVVLERLSYDQLCTGSKTGEEPRPSTFRLRRRHAGKRVLKNLVNDLDRKLIEPVSAKRVRRASNVRTSPGRVRRRLKAKRVKRKVKPAKDFKPNGVAGDSSENMETGRVAVVIGSSMDIGEDVPPVDVLVDPTETTSTVLDHSEVRDPIAISSPDLSSFSVAGSLTDENATSSDESVEMDLRATAPVHHSGADESTWWGLYGSDDEDERYPLAEKPPPKQPRCSRSGGSSTRKEQLRRIFQEIDLRSARVSSHKRTSLECSTGQPCLPRQSTSGSTDRGTFAAKESANVSEPATSSSAVTNVPSLRGDIQDDLRTPESRRPSVFDVMDSNSDSNTSAPRSTTPVPGSPVPSLNVTPPSSPVRFLHRKPSDGSIFNI